MCGIVGKLNVRPGAPVTVEEFAAMLATLRHRGPDEFGVYVDDHVGLGSARLSIIDLAGGQQPIHNEDETVWVVFNGEVYNYLELRTELESAGHRFYTQSDTEVIVHLYEERGADFVQAMNGQFAIALWDRAHRELLLVRDRLGIRPIYYHLSAEGRLLFASEVKALLVDPSVPSAVDAQSLGQVFTFWTTLTPRSIFRDILTVPPGHILRQRDGHTTLAQYWAPCFPEAVATAGPLADAGNKATAAEDAAAAAEDAARELRDLLIDATRLRLRADVPVGAYLSGGIDSSTTAALIRHYTGRHLRTFGIGFADPAYDEKVHQAQMVAHLGTEHSQIDCTDADIGAAMPEVVWHAEMPLVRTAPAPMFLLSGLVHAHGFKVVLTGEGADEVLAGYDIFKEAQIRRFWARAPDSALRPLLLRRLYPDIGRLSQQNDAYLRAFFAQGLAEPDDPFYSHRLRWTNASRCQRFLSADLRRALADHDALAGLRTTLPARFGRWHPLAQAQYLEMTIFLAEYLLSSQGDRMAMAHAVEGRYPFLDHRVVEFCSRLPARWKLRGLREKWLLRRAMAGLLPAPILERQKRPYRAPIAGAFFGPRAPDWVAELLSPRAIHDLGYFAPAPVERLRKRCEGGMPLGETDEMALCGILSTQWLHRLFVVRSGAQPALPRLDLVVRRGAPQ